MLSGRAVSLFFVQNKSNLRYASHVRSVAQPKSAFAVDVYCVAKQLALYFGTL